MIKSECNFRGKYHHIFHNTEDNYLGHQLNTITDCLINLSDNLYKTDNKIIDLLEQENPNHKGNNILAIIENQDFIKSQIEQLTEHVLRTLNKADKFPSKKDIRLLIDTPTQIELRISKQLEIFHEDIKKDIKEFKELYLN